MNNLIIFSKNRPMQCQATIDSLELRTKGFFNKISVLYKADKEYEEGYNILRDRRPYINYAKEKNFKKDLLSLFVYDYTCMAADDDLFYQDFNKLCLSQIEGEVACFSLRLGLNIDYCYPMDKPNKIKNYEEDGEFIKWKWHDEEYDFAYPLSVVSHIFKTDEIRGWSEQGAYNNPNQYEIALQSNLERIKPYLAAYKQSKAFGVPANRVNDTCPNRNGLKHNYSTEELNKMYLEGKTINITKIPDIHSAQQEIKYVFQ